MPKPLSDFLPQVLTHVPGCIDLLAKNAVLEAAIEFCERTKVNDEALAAIDVLADTGTYNLTAPASTEIVEILSVKHDGESLDPTSRAALDADRPDWETDTDTPLAYFSDPGRTTVTLGPTPDADLVGGLVVRAAVRPARTATTIDDFLYNQHLQAIAHGALARLFAMAKKEWTSAAKSKEHRDAFDLQISNATVKRAKGHVNAPLRTTPYYSI